MTQKIAAMVIIINNKIMKIFLSKHPCTDNNRIWRFCTFLPWAIFCLSLKQKRHWLQNWKAGRETYEKTDFCHKQKYDLFLLGSAWCRHQHLHCRTNVLIYHGPDPRYWTGTWVSYELVHIQNYIFIPPWFPYNFIGIWTISMVRFWSIAGSWLHQCYCCYY